MAKMRIATAGACVGHLCDNCDRCLAGDCCGSDVVNVELPRPADYDGPLFAPLGSIRIDEQGLIVCHMCGDRYKLLGPHISRKHGVTSDAYRSMFGLRCGESLSTRKSVTREMTVAEKAQLAERLEGYRRAFTSEQISAWSRERVSREQSMMQFDPETQRRRAAVWQGIRVANPEVDAQWKRRIIRARRQSTDEGKVCVACGTMFCQILNRGGQQRSPRKTCGAPACVQEVRRRAQAASAQARTHL